jgi:hypothetical protein
MQYLKKPRVHFNFTSLFHIRMGVGQRWNRYRSSKVQPSSISSVCDGLYSFLTQAGRPPVDRFCPGEFQRTKFTLVLSVRLNATVSRFSLGQ